jgi:predicted transcriptional regulator
MTIAIDPELKKRLDRLGKVAGQSRSELIGDLLLSVLEQAELVVKATSDPVLMGAIGRVMADPGVLRNMIVGLRSELSEDQLDLFKTRLDALTGVSGELVKVPKKRKLKG